MQNKDSLVHQEHEKIVSIIRHWYHDPFDDMGYFAVQRQWGTYWSNAQVYVSDLAVNEIDSFLDDLRTHFSDQPESILIHLDNPEDDESLGPALIKAGCTEPTTDVYFAHIETQRNKEINSTIKMVPITNENLALFCDTKIRAWTGNEDGPGHEELQIEITRRKQELEGTGRGLLALVNDVPAGFIWWHEESSHVRWISQLATRSLFRKQGIWYKNDKGVP